MKYRSKPVIKEAKQFTQNNSNEQMDEIVMWINQGKMTGDQHAWHNGTYIFIQTLEGEMTAAVDDYIVKGVKGEFYPCKPDIFEMTYEKVEEK